VEVWDYKPVSEKTIVALLDRAASSAEIASSNSC
jgi:calcineurin-like phosphoesterase family protein